MPRAHLAATLSSLQAIDARRRITAAAATAAAAAARAAAVSADAGTHSGGSGPAGHACGPAQLNPETAEEDLRADIEGAWVAVGGEMVVDEQKKRSFVESMLASAAKRRKADACVQAPPA